MGVRLVWFFFFEVLAEPLLYFMKKPGKYYKTYLYGAENPLLLSYDKRGGLFFYSVRFLLYKNIATPAPQIRIYPSMLSQSGISPKTKKPSTAAKMTCV